MRKLRLMLACLMATIVCTSGIAMVGAQPSNTYEVYLGDAVAKEKADFDVWQSNSALNEGGSSAKYGLEVSDGISNKFLRVANFDGSYFSNSTSVNFALDYQATWQDSLTISFNYRLNEGAVYYEDDEIVFGLNVGGAVKQLKIGDLTLNTVGNYNWQTLNVTLPISNSNVADRITLIYYYDGTVSRTKTLRYLDVDNFKVETGSVVLCQTDVEFASVSTSSSLVLSVDYSTNNVENKSQYLLKGEDIVNFGENTQYLRQESTAFAGADVASVLPHAGGCLYRGSASVNAGESDLYVLYDANESNSFLRLGNFNGNSGVKNSRFYILFYDNNLKNTGNMPVTLQITVSFDYRLYMSEKAQSEIDFSSQILNFSTRSASTNNSGSVSFDELKINQKGDGTWHTFTTVLQVYNTTTNNTLVTYYGYKDPSFNAEVFMDIDNLRMSPMGSNDNYVYADGTFEGMVPTVSTQSDPFNEKVFNNFTLGSAGEKVCYSPYEYAMKLDNGENASLQLGWNPSSNAYHVSFDVLEESGNLDLYFGGRTGDKISLTVGNSGEFLNGALNVYWTKNASGYTCDLYYARLAKEVLVSLDLVCQSQSGLTVDNLFIGEIQSVCNTAGNYQTFSQSYQELLAVYGDGSAFKDDTNKLVKKVLFVANEITANSSQVRMNEVLEDLSLLLSEENKKSDLSELEEVLADAESVYLNGQKSDYTRASWLIFERELAKARAINGNDSQDTVDAQAQALYGAIMSLTPVTQTNSNTVTLALGIGGGLFGLGGIALATITITRRKKNEND